MSKAIEYAKQIEGVTEKGGFCDPEFMPLVSEELRRLAGVEKQLEAAQAELAAIRALEPVAHENANGVVRRAGYQWDAIEKLTALVALPEQK